ncbi:hypothetical protein QJS04_geneDACA013929 [Acorus gramineus]|uniref:Uncharacterized protein n=1 Tax=Acorus gramineus TaxID=55184 RepID=A0AAV9AY32_ACOGR|nr:hypothetical protein QJS04_geneDACA013929 [Acorus gramineus]
MSQQNRESTDAEHNRYVATLREQLEQLAAETTAEGLPSISKAKLNDYSEKIEALAAKIAASPLFGWMLQPHLPESLDSVDEDQFEDQSQHRTKNIEIPVTPSPGMRRRLVPHTKVEDKTPVTAESDLSAPIKLDASAQAHIEKHSENGQTGFQSDFSLK